MNHSDSSVQFVQVGWALWVDMGLSATAAMLTVLNAAAVKAVSITAELS